MSRKPMDWWEREHVQKKIASGEQLDAYAWPGGYPIIYVDGQNEILCPDCANKIIADYDPDDDPDGYWKTQEFPQTFYIHYEGPPEFCNCGAEIESAYGDPWDTED